MRHLKGSCLCGAVQIEVPDNFGFVGNCHCSECRKWTGSAFASGGGIKPAELQIVRGADKLAGFRKSQATEFVFCSACGSSLYSLKRELDLCVIRLGILDDAPSQSPALHMYVGSKAPWHDITDDLPVFESTP